MPLLEVSLGVTATFLAVEAYRYHRHRRNLARIPHRIHVNGTRGKSSVTRLIYAALRQLPGHRVAAKTTGTAPRFLFPDGREVPVFRAGRPNILEQLRIVQRAVEAGADILVLECMAITPEYLRVLEDRIVQSTVGVITNIREDHLDTMGPTLAHVARHLALTTPRNGVLFTADQRFTRLLEAEARRRGSRLVVVRPEEWVQPGDLDGFSYVEHAENVALALAVAQHFGVSREQALKGMWQAPPDPGALRRFRIALPDKTLWVYNAFAANDPESTRLIWQNVVARHPGVATVALFVARKDRPQRTEAFARLLGRDLVADWYLLAGFVVHPVAAALRRHGVPADRIRNLEGQPADRVVQALLSLPARELLVVTMGNIVGLGQEIVDRLQALHP